MISLSIRWAALALGLVALSACSSLHGPTSSYAHQRQPLDSFSKSRPKVAALLRQYPALEQWLRTEFVRPLGSYRLAWDDGAPGGGAMASHRYSAEHWFVVVRIERHVPPADQLAALVYEICNSRASYLRVGELTEQAAKQTISRDAFVDGLLEIEITAQLRAGQLLPQIMPLQPSERESLQIYNALLDAPADMSHFEAWRRRHSRGGYDVRAFYGKQYDQIVADAKTHNCRSAGAKRRGCSVGRAFRNFNPLYRFQSYPRPDSRHSLDVVDMARKRSTSSIIPCHCLI